MDGGMWGCRTLSDQIWFLGNEINHVFCLQENEILFTLSYISSKIGYPSINHKF